MMEKRLLFLVNGMGLGNSTRCSAIMQELVKHNFKIDIMTSGNGLSYFLAERDRLRLEVEDIFAVEETSYHGNSSTKLGFLDLLRSARSFVRRLRENRKSLEKILRGKTYSALVTDSDYSVCLRKNKYRDIPLIAINNADAIFEKPLRRFLGRREVFNWQLLVEGCDYIFHRLTPDYLVSPRLEMSEPYKKGRKLITPPIVRREIAFPNIKCAKRQPNVRDILRILIVPGGSVFGFSPEQLSVVSWPEGLEVKILAEPRLNMVQNSEKDVCENVCFVGRSYRVAELFDWADALVVNGGYCSISEALVRQKPVLIVPVKGHSEQWINACSLEAAGLAILSSGDDFEEKLKVFIKNYELLKISHAKSVLRSDGAQAAADWIREIVDNDFNR